jgi:hypothetical protein
MRKIDLTSYDVTVPDGKGGEQTLPYDVRGSLVDGMYHHDLRLNSKDLFAHDRIAQKIQNSNGFVLLEDSEYERVKSTIETITGFRKEDVEFVRRVIDAPEVTVKEGE